MIIEYRFYNSGSVHPSISNRFSLPTLSYLLLCLSVQLGYTKDEFMLKIASYFLNKYVCSFLMVGTFIVPVWAQQNSDPEVYANVTTRFEGISFNLKRLLRDPEQPEKFRMIAEIVGEKGEKEILYILPAPALVDDLGNLYSADLMTGVDACRRFAAYDANWVADPSFCSSYGNPARFARLSPGIGRTSMLRFAPSDRYNTELALIATQFELRLHFVVATPGQDLFTTHEVVLTGISKPD